MITFLIIALIAAVGIAKIIFIVAIAPFLISLIAGFARGGFRRTPL